MAECGIEKYDELPARVALIDVDGLRHNLYFIRNTSGLRYYVGRFFLTLQHHRISREKIEQQIINDLEEARKIHAGEIKPFYTKFLDGLRQKVGV